MPGKVSSYKELIVWQKGIQLVKSLYDLTNSFPAHELYGLTSQIHRASVSIPSNLAEGYARASRKEYVQFVSIAYGSGAELETLLLLAKMLKYISEHDFGGVSSDLNEIQKMLNKLRQNLKRDT